MAWRYFCHSIVSILKNDLLFPVRASLAGSFFSPLDRTSYTETLAGVCFPKVKVSSWSRCTSFIQAWTAWKRLLALTCGGPERTLMWRTWGIHSPVLKSSALCHLICIYATGNIWVTWVCLHIGYASLKWVLCCCCCWGWWWKHTLPVTGGFSCEGSFFFYHHWRAV